jgi:hypothetical protein
MPRLDLGISWRKITIPAPAIQLMHGYKDQAGEEVTTEMAWGDAKIKS